jgi:hypothetical protein
MFQSRLAEPALRIRKETAQGTVVPEFYTRMSFHQPPSLSPSALLDVSIG